MSAELPHLTTRQVLAESRRYMVSFFQAAPGRITLIIVLMVLQALSAGIGVLFILPLLSTLGLAGKAASEHMATQLVSQALTSLGVPLNVTAMLMVYVLLIALVATLRSYSLVLSAAVRQQYVHRLRLDMYQHVMHARWQALGRYPLAELGYLLSGQVNLIGHLSHQGLQLASKVLLGLGFFGVSLIVSWQLSLVALLFGVLSSLILLPLYRKTLRSGRAQLNAHQDLFKMVTGHLHSLRVIKLFGAEDRFAHDLSATSKKLERQDVKLTRINAVTNWVLTVMAAVLVAGFFYVAIVWLDSELAQLIVLLVILARMLPLLSGVQKHVQHILHILPASANAAAVSTTLLTAQEPQHGDDAEPVIMQRSCALRNVTFRYNADQRPVLNDFSGVVEANKVTAVTGPSGVGKSTVADLLAGLQRPEEGVLCVDDLPLSETQGLAWRHSVAYVVQEPLLFSETVYHNLAWVRAGVTRAEVLQALRDAAAWDFVQQLPLGMDTPIGDHGRSLSGGQRQRLSIARALLRAPQLLILDEATSALDKTSEAFIAETIQNLRGKLTVVVISHQASICDLADHVIDLEAPAYDS